MIGVIGGSGFYTFLEDPRSKTLSTPFGTIPFQIGEIEGKEVCFIPRHGSGHKLLPHQINYRGNIYTALELGVEKIYATNAVGSSNPNVGPGSFVVLSQIIDRTNRISTFFDDPRIEITTRQGRSLSGVVHTDVSDPFNETTRQELISACKQLDELVELEGTISVFNGPRYETAAEIRAETQLGSSFFGMTTVPEAFLAKEIELPYATLAVVTNYAAGLQSTITHDEVGELFSRRINAVKQVISYAIVTY